MTNVETLRLTPFKLANKSGYTGFLLSTPKGETEQRECETNHGNKLKEDELSRDESESICESPVEINTNNQSKWECFAGCIPGEQYLSWKEMMAPTNKETVAKSPVKNIIPKNEELHENKKSLPNELTKSRAVGPAPLLSINPNAEILDTISPLPLGDTSSRLSPRLSPRPLTLNYSRSPPLSPKSPLLSPRSPSPISRAPPLSPRSSPLSLRRMPASGKKRTPMFQECKLDCQSGDDESTTASSIGNSLFSNYGSLPSTPDSILPTGSNIDDDSSAASSVGNLSLISADSAAEKLETLADIKMKKVDEKETIGDVSQSAAALIRQSSSLSIASSRSMSFRRKKNVSRVENERIPKQNRFSYNPKRKKLALAQELRAIVNENGRYNTKFASVTLLLAAVYEDEKEYELALKLHREVVSIYTTKLGDYDHNTIESKLTLAKLLEKMEVFDESIELIHHVLNMRRALYGESDPNIPEIMSYGATILRKQGRQLQAIKELKRALKLYRTALGDSHPLVTSTVDEISSLYIEVGNYSKATAILEEVVKLKAGTAGINTIDVADTLSVLANAYESAGDRSNELRTLKKCYSVITVACGESSDEATEILERLAQNYRAQKDRGKAVTAYLALLHTRKKYLGNKHPTVAKTYLELGIALREDEKPEKARKCMKQALSIYVDEGKRITDIGMIAEVMRELALNSVDTGNLSDAIKILKQELAIRRKMGEKEYCNVAITLHHLGTTEIQQRNYSKALNFFMEALSIYDKMEDEVGISFAKTLYCTGIVFEATQNQNRANESFRESRNLLNRNGLSREEVKEIISSMEKLRNINEEKSSANKFGSSNRK